MLPKNALAVLFNFAELSNKENNICFLTQYLFYLR
jgi:hypothetical protein